MPEIQPQPTAPEMMLTMLKSMVATMEELLAAGDPALPMPSTHVCGHGKDSWTLLYNLIDHEAEHFQAVNEARYEAKDAKSPMERIAADWLSARAHFLSSLIGLDAEEFHTPAGPGRWSPFQVADHLLKLEHHALATMRRDGALPRPGGS